TIPRVLCERHALRVNRAGLRTFACRARALSSAVPLVHVSKRSRNGVATGPCYTPLLNARLLALALAVAGGAHAAVVLRSPEQALKAVADKLHSTVIDVSGRVSVPAGGGTAMPEKVTHGTGTF